MASGRLRSAAIGKRGEDLAVEWLRQRGYVILERNWRRPCGELDIIAEWNGTLVGVEVKTRTSAAAGEPEEAVTLAKRRKLLLTIQTYLMEQGDEQRPYQLDAIAIRISGNGQRPDIRHYPAMSLEE